jgi:hypothetical protein
VVTVGGAAVACLLVVGAFLLAGPDAVAGLVLWGIAGAMLIGAAVIAVFARPRILALRQVAARNPHAAVLLARRQPAVISDLAAYLGDRDIYDDVSDRWVVGAVDDRGLGVWSVGREPEELLVMPWDEIGYLERTRLENGAPGVAIDVRPFADPLVVSVGYAAFGVLGSFGRAGVDEVVAAANALRPPGLPFPPTLP